MSMKPLPMPEPWRQAAESFDIYMRTLGYAESTRHTRWRDLRRFAERTGLTPDSVTTADLLSFLDTCRSREYKKRTRATLKMFYAWYCDTAKMRDDNPAAELPRLRESKPHPKPVPDICIQQALNRATDKERLAILLAAECGLRRAEIAAVHSDNVIAEIDGRRSLVVVGKGDKQRVIPLPDDLADAIQSAHGYVFPGRWGGHVEPSYIGKHVGRLLPEGYSVHKLRHRFATVAYADSHDLLSVSRALGHSKPETTQRYTALADGQLRPLVDAATFSAKPSEDKPSCGVAAPLPVQRVNHVDTERRMNGNENERIRYAPDGVHRLKGRADRQIDAVRSAFMLCMKILNDGPNVSKLSFRWSAERLAEEWDVSARGYARRSTPVRAGARRLQNDGLIELIEDHAGMLCGNVIAEPRAFVEAVNKLADEYYELTADD